METGGLRKPEQAVILCGGLGTRMRPYTNLVPKPMILCNGKPFLLYLIQQLIDLGVIRFLLLTGYLGDQIEDYFGDGRSFGCQIKYFRGPIEWNTGRRIWEARSVIDGRFFLLYSDNFVPFPIYKLLDVHDRCNASLTFMAAPKRPGNIEIDDKGIVQQYDNKRASGMQYVEIGYMVVEKDRTLGLFESTNCSFSDVLKSMAKKGEVSAFIQYDKYYSISDPERWRLAETYLRTKKIILIDRDGVINRKAPPGEYISNWAQFEWIQETRQAMGQLAKAGFKFIVISNQAGVARGLTKSSSLKYIHTNLKKKMLEEGVDVLNIYICPHHWEEKCFCRKPMPGLFFKASSEFSFRLDQTVYIGDDPRDCLAARNAGCGSIFLGSESDYRDLPPYNQPDFTSSNLIDALAYIQQTVVS